MEEGEVWGQGEYDLAVSLGTRTHSASIILSDRSEPNALVLPIADDDETSVPPSNLHTSLSRSVVTPTSDSQDAFSFIYQQPKAPPKPSFVYEESFPAWRMRVRRVVVESPWFERFILVVVLLNCITMSVDDSWARVVDAVCFAAFSVEVAVKMVSCGLYKIQPWAGSPASEVPAHSGAYFRSAWNTCDFLITAVTALTVFSNGSSLAGLRSFRILRLLKVVSVSEVRVLVSALLASLPKLFDVIVLYVSFLFVLAILATQLWKGVLRNQCVSVEVIALQDITTFEAQFSDVSESYRELYDAVLQTGSVLDIKNFLRTVLSWEDFAALFPVNLDQAVCTTDNDDLGGFHCPWGFVCTEQQNPHHNLLSFDNVLSSILSLFVAVTLEGWSDIMYKTADGTANFGVVFVFYTFLLAFGAFFIINLTLVIITYAFEGQHQKEKRIETEKRRQKRVQKLKKKRMMSSEDVVPAGHTKSIGNKVKNWWKKIKKSGTSKALTQGMPCEVRHNGAWVHGVAGEIFIPSANLNLGVQHSPTLPSNDNTQNSMIRVYLTNGEVVTATRIKDVKPLPLGTAPLRVRELVRHRYFTVIVVAAIILNTICLALDHQGESADLNTTLNTANFVFSGVFLIEMVLKLFGFGVYGYFHDAWNAFDFAVVILSAIDISLNRTAGTTVLRALRILRLFKLAHHSTHIRKWVLAIIRSLKETVVLSGIILLVVCSYALVGVQFMKGDFCGLDETCAAELHHVDGEDALQCVCEPRENFNTFGDGFLSMFQVLTGENWSVLMYNGMAGIARGRADTNSYVAVQDMASWWKEALVASFFVSFYFVAHYLLLNLFVAIILHQSGVAEKEAILAGQREEATLLSLQHNNSMNTDTATLNISKGRKKKPRSSGGVTFVRDTSPDGSFASNDVFFEARQLPAQLSESIYEVNNEEELQEINQNIPQYSPVNVHDPNDPRENDTKETSFVRSHATKQNSVSFASEAPSSVGPQRGKQNFFAKAKHKSMLAALSIPVAEEVEPGHEDDEVLPQPSPVSCISATPKNSGSPAMKRKKYGVFDAEDRDEPLLALGDDREEEEEEEEEEGEEILERAFFCISGRNVVRRVLRRVVTHQVFEVGVLLLILVSTVFITLWRPLEPPDTPNNQMLDSANIVVTALFVLEAVLKIITFGFVMHRSSYLRRENAFVWNFLDFFIVVTSLLSFVGPDLVFFRILRVLRPLRFINRSEGMRTVVHALVGSLPAVANVMCITLLVWTVCAIMGVQLFGGKFYACSESAWGDVGGLVTYRGVVYDLSQRKGCLEYPGAEYRWSTYPSNFDNAPEALLSLFHVATVEGYSDLLHLAMDGVGYDEAPQKNHNAYVAVAFFVVFTFIGSFFVKNLFISVLLDTYYVEDRRRAKKSLLLSDKQKKWVQSYREMLRGVSRPPEFFYDTHSQTPRYVARKVAGWKHFEVMIQSVIVLNVLIMATEHYEQTPFWDILQNSADITFVAIFTLEFAVKMIAHGAKGYFAQRWNRFDCFILVLSWVGFIVVMATSVSVDVSVWRILRLARLLRLVKWAKGITLLLKTLYLALPLMLNVTAILALLYIVYGAIGVRLFGRASRGSGITANANFEYFTTAVVTLIRVSTGEGWNNLMTAYRRDSPECDAQLDGCVSTPVVVIYFVSFIVASGFVLLNLFIAVILDAFQEVVQEARFEGELRKADMKGFKSAWKRKDPKQTFRMNAADLPELLREIGPPMGVNKDTEMHHVWDEVSELDLYATNGFVDMQPLLQALFSRLHGTLEDLRLPDVIVQTVAIKADVRFQARQREERYKEQGFTKIPIHAIVGLVKAQASVRGMLVRNKIRKNYFSQKTKHVFRFETNSSNSAPSDESLSSQIVLPVLE